MICRRRIVGVRWRWRVHLASDPFPRTIPPLAHDLAFRSEIHARLKAIRSDIEALEAKHVEEVANEYNINVHELAASERGALERLNSLKDEVRF